VKGAAVAADQAVEPAPQTIIQQQPGIDVDQLVRVRDRLSAALGD